MDDRTRVGFDRLLQNMDDPPTWDQLTTRSTGLRPDPRRFRVRGAWVAVAAFVVVLIGFGATAWLLQPGGDDFAAAQVDHLRLEWREDLTLRCEGMDIGDDGGFSEAIIDIWGPSDGNRYRLETLFPDGTSDTVVIEGPFEAPQRVWAPGLGVGTAVRQAWCGSGNSSWAVSSTPISPFGLAEDGFVTLTYTVGDRTIDGLEQLRGLDPSPEAATWRGIDVQVYVDERSFPVDELGIMMTTSMEYWVDPGAGRLERVLVETRSEVLGDSLSVLEVINRDTVAADAVSFEPDGLRLVFDRSALGSEDSVVVTTSIPPLSEPIMTGATQLNPEDLPTPYLRLAAAEAITVWKINVADAYLLLYGGYQPIVISESCDELAQLELPPEWGTRCGDELTNP